MNNKKKFSLPEIPSWLYFIFCSIGVPSFFLHSYVPLFIFAGFLVYDCLLRPKVNRRYARLRGLSYSGQGIVKTYNNVIEPVRIYTASGRMRLGDVFRGEPLALCIFRFNHIEGQPFIEMQDRIRKNDDLLGSGKSMFLLDLAEKAIVVESFQSKHASGLIMTEFNPDLMIDPDADCVIIIPVR